MSNARWLALFEKLREQEVRRLQWKFLDDEKVFEAYLPDTSNLLPERFADILPAPYGLYRDIEWIEIPNLTPEQATALTNWKKSIPWAKSPSGLRVVAYTWQARQDELPMPMSNSERRE
jgi:hypothetical protein